MVALKRTPTCLRLFGGAAVAVVAVAVVAVVVVAVAVVVVAVAVVAAAAAGGSGVFGRRARCHSRTGSRRAGRCRRRCRPSAPPTRAAAGRRRPASTWSSRASRCRTRSMAPSGGCCCGAAWTKKRIIERTIFFQRSVH